MNRDMYYQNLNQGYQNPGMIIPPSGYNINTNYQAYGPNVMPNMQYQNNNYNEYNDINDRFDKIDKQIKNLDSRLQKLESTSNNASDNVYMI